MASKHKKCNECGYEHIPCKYCGGLVYETDNDSIDNGYHDLCRQNFIESEDKKLRAELHAQGKWARLCWLCGQPLVKGKCAFMFGYTPDQASLTCMTCIEKEKAQLREMW